MTQRERAERLVREETRAIVVRLVRKLNPRLPVAGIERSAARCAVEVTLTDAEVERCAAMTDDEVRESWRAHLKPRPRRKLVLDFGEVPPPPPPRELTQGQIDHLKRKARRAERCHYCGAVGRVEPFPWAPAPDVLVRCTIPNVTAHLACLPEVGR